MIINIVFCVRVYCDLRQQIVGPTNPGRNFSGTTFPSQIRTVLVLFFLKKKTILSIWFAQMVLSDLIGAASVLTTD